MAYPASEAPKLEGNRDGFRLEGLVAGSAKAWQALRQIEKILKPGMTEHEIQRAGEEILKKLGSKKNWHRVTIRIDADTLLRFNAPANPSAILTATSIVFIDIGPVFEFDGVEYEADVGDTFSMDADPEKARVIEASRTLFKRVSDIWRNESICGVELYKRAEIEAERFGVVLNQDVDGHRVGDFPHGVFFKGGIGELDFKPGAGVWILEIQVRHPTLPYGAFYEDNLI
jgi:methionine aminopeptidase